MADKKTDKLVVLKEVMELMDTLKDGVELSNQERVHLNLAYREIYAAWEGNYENI